MAQTVNVIVGAENRERLTAAGVLSIDEKSRIQALDRTQPGWHPA